jgi:hypothetical protein
MKNDQQSRQPNRSRPSSSSIWFLPQQHVRYFRNEAHGWFVDPGKKKGLENEDDDEDENERKR